MRGTPERTTAAIRYRLAGPEDALAIGRLARRVTRRWILPEQPASAAPELLRGMSARVIRRKIIAGQRFHLACCEDGGLAGVAAMRDDCHLFQFFVSTRLHGRGIARRHAAVHAECLGHGGAGVSALRLRGQRPADHQPQRPADPADATGAVLSGTTRRRHAATFGNSGHAVAPVGRP